MPALIMSRPHGAVGWSLIVHFLVNISSFVYLNMTLHHTAYILIVIYYGRTFA